MDQDFYIEDTSPWKIAIIIIIVAALIGGGIFAYYKYFRDNIVKLKEVNVELGEKLPTDIDSYISAKNINDYKLDVSNVSVDEEGKTNVRGEYSYKVSRNGEIKKGKVYVVDTIKPVVETVDITVGVKENFEPSEFLKSCDDLSLPCVATYKNKNDITLNDNAGTYDVDLIISDAAGNSVTKKVKLTVSTETTLEKQKASDLTPTKTSLEDDNVWNKTYTLKLTSGVDPETEEFVKQVSELSAKEYQFDKQIAKKEIIEIYNKYDYVIGFSIMVTFDDNSVLFVTSENAKEIVETTEE